MPKNKSMLQNDEHKESDTFFKHTTHPYKPSFLKDPKTLFDAYSTDAISTFHLASSIDKEKVQGLTQQLSAAPVAEDICGVGFSSEENISSDQQPTWLIPAVATLKLIKKMPALPRKKDNHSLLIRKIMKNTKISAIISCLDGVTLLLLGKVSERNRSKK